MVIRDIGFSQWMMEGAVRCPWNPGGLLPQLLLLLPQLLLLLLLPYLLQLTKPSQAGGLCLCSLSSIHRPESVSVSVPVSVSVSVEPSGGSCHTCFN